MKALKVKLSVLFLVYLLQLAGLHAQSTFKVLNNQHRIYLFVPNPISYSRYDRSPDQIRFKTENGRIDTIKNIVYWTPLQSGMLYIQENTNGPWATIDSIQAGSYKVLPKYFQVEPVAPYISIDGYPDLLRFDSLKLNVPWEFNHLPLDSLCRIKSFDVIFYNEGRDTVIDTLRNISQGEGRLIREKIQQTSKIYWIDFRNIIFESKLWVDDRKYHTGRIESGEFMYTISR